MLTIVREVDGNTALTQDASTISTLLADTTRPFWVDLEVPSETEFAILNDVLHFHPLAIEDAMRPHQRPKVD